ncbi:MAG: hypothetical protein KDC84_09605 [Crocinitomicaceae bacterium]|nr:hypothetical protein [Crocinitomicaceae bacterium]
MRYLVLILFFPVFLAISQEADTVFLKDGDKISVKIIEIEETKIHYKKIDNPDGPKYLLTVEDINYIILSSGEVINNKGGKLIAYNETVEIKKTNENTTTYKDPFYNEAKDKQKKERVQRSILYNTRKNMIGFNYASFFTVDMELSYERILDKVGYIGLKVPIRFNLGVQTNYLNKINIFTSGIQANIYPTGQGRFSYFTGPILLVRVMRDNDQITYSGSNSITITIEPTRSTYLSFYMNNGCLFRASPFLYFGLSMGFGFRKDLARSYENSIFEMIGEASISYRF